MKQRADWISYLVTVGVVGVALVVRWLVNPWLQDFHPYVTFYVAVAISAWLGGMRAALVATALGFVLAWYCFVPTRLSFELRETQHAVGLFMYLMVCFSLAGFAEAMGRAQRRAEIRRELLRITLASIGDAVITTDSEGRVTSLNAVAATLTGLTENDALGRPLDEIFHILNEETRQPAESPVQRVLADGRVCGLANHTVLISKDGTEWPIADSAAPIRDATGEVLGVVMVFRDVTEERRAARQIADSESRKAAILQTALECVITIDQEGKILDFNPAAEQTFGYRTADVVGREMAELIIPPSLRERHRQGLARYLATGEGPVLNRRIELPAVRADGTEFPSELAITRINREGPPIFTGYLRDITERKRAEAEQARLAAIVKHSDDAIISKTLNGTILTWNAGAQRIFGYEAAEVVGRPITILLPPERVSEEEQILERLRRGELIEHFETVRLTKDGRRLDVSLTVSPLKDATGTVVGASKILRDVTERKRIDQALRESREQLRVTLASIGDAVITTDTEGVITYLNAVAESLTGWSNTDAAGQPLDTVFRVVNEQTREPVENPAARALRKGVIVGLANHTVLICRDGSERPIDDSAAPIKDEHGHVAGCVLIFRDVSERRDVEQRIHSLMTELQHTDRRKDEFLATLAHELRGPLAPLSNMLEVMKRADGNRDTNQQAQVMMERQVGQLVRLVDDLLDVSRITRNRLELRKQSVELASVVHHVLETCRPMAKEFEHEVTVTLPLEPIYLHADPTRLAQVFSNLFSNACKYTEPKGQVWLTAERQADEVVVTIKDTGIGIPPDKLENIFEMFSQVDTALERSQGGLGIGLTLVKRLVEMHDGTVEARSAGPGRGSEFIVRLPIVIKQPQPQRRIEAIGAEAAKAARRILVVDDNPDSAASLAMLLTMSGNELCVAHDGLEAVSAAEQFGPDVVLLDIGLPKLNGFDAARRIREQPWGQSMTLIALTGWGQEEDRRKSKAAGFDHHLIKPVDYNTLAKLLG